LLKAAEFTSTSTKCYMAATNMIQILGIAGSLRNQSYNRLLLNAAQELMPATAQLEILDLEDIPIFNQDKEKTLPQSVERLKDKIRQADGILFASPEYNYSIPAVLKNAIDWASRPIGTSAWARKPAALMGASPGLLGTARAQYHLRQILVALDMPTVNQPEVVVGLAHERFDARGHLTDEKSKQLLKTLLENLVDLVQRQQR
jgi:chromate reductase, NAD(P)H dehydrogenase (quinone)